MQLLIFSRSAFSYSLNPLLILIFTYNIEINPEFKIKFLNQEKKDNNIFLEEILNKGHKKKHDKNNKNYIQN